MTLSKRLVVLLVLMIGIPSVADHLNPDNSKTRSGDRYFAPAKITCVCECHVVDGKTLATRLCAVRPSGQYCYDFSYGFELNSPSDCKSLQSESCSGYSIIDGKLLQEGAILRQCHIEATPKR